MAEWTNALVLKTRGGKTPVGSNPTTPAQRNRPGANLCGSLLPFYRRLSRAEALVAGQSAQTRTTWRTPWDGPGEVEKADVFQPTRKLQRTSVIGISKEYKLSKNSVPKNSASNIRIPV